MAAISQIIGRDREQERLRRYLTPGHGGGFVLVGGEAGIGKTALVNWLADEASRQGALILNGGCYDLTATPAYGPWLDAFERYQPTDGSLPHPPVTSIEPTDTLTWFETVQSYLAGIATSRQIVIVLEDLHWSDSASLDLLRHLARKREVLPVLLIGTYRNDEITRDHPLYRLMPLLVREAGAERIDLRRLEAAAIHTAVSSRYDLIETDQQRLTSYLARYSEGNPLCLFELLHTLEAERLLQSTGEHWTLLEPLDAIVPPLLHQIIDRRLSGLSSATRDALAIAAIIGDQAPIGLWAAIGDYAEEQLTESLDEAIDAHVIEALPTGSGLRFRHALVREAIYTSLPLTRRRPLHRRAAEALTGASSASPDSIAYHFQQAGDGRAVEWFVRAGMRARRTGAWLTAAERFAAAASLLEDNDNRLQERGWLWFLSGFLLRHADVTRSIAAHDEAERLAIACGDRVLAAFTAYARGAVRNHTGIRSGMPDLEAGVAAIDVLLTEQQILTSEQLARSVIRRLLPDDDQPTVESVDTDAPRVNVQRGVLIHWLSHAGRYQEAIVVGEQYLATMSATFGPDYPRIPQCYSGLHGVAQAYAALGRPDDARRMYALAREGARTFNDQAIVEYTIWSELQMAILPYATDRLDERARLIADANHAWDRCYGITISTAGEDAPSELQVDLLEGRWQKAEQLATDHLTAPWINQLQEAIIVLGTLAQRQGRPETAWQHINTLLSEGPSTTPGNVYFPHGIAAIALAAELALDAGESTAATNWIETHRHWLDWSGATLWQADHQLMWANHHDRSGDLLQARHHAEQALTLGSDPRQPLRLVSAWRLLGSIDRQEGRYDRAADLLHQSIALAAACLAPFERVLSLLAMAELQITMQQVGEAQALLNEARAICAPLGAHPTLRRIVTLESEIATGSTVRPFPDALTAREVEVLRLIAVGQSNRKIADTLFLSPRTVERHIANIYDKIDAHNRAEATAYALRQQLA